MYGRPNQGFTLVEIFVAIAIIGIIMTLILVGVQSARESARRITCQNNLHQVGIAVANFTNTTRVFPSLLANRGTKQDAAFDHSAFLTILPELEVAITKRKSVYVMNDPKDRAPTVLRCPSANEFLGYRYCYGSGVQTLNKLDGILRIYKGLSPSEITDGLSNTALISERMSGNEQRKPVGIAILPGYLTDSGFSNDCTRLTTATSYVPDVGIDWRGVQPRDLVYSHFSLPNNTHWDCQAGFLHQLISARSYHSGGVTVLFADGHVGWMSANLDVSTWRAFGTVAGHEVLADNP
jgi:prepilin-type N-terminal cleavage/methylation domain-containing protein/prepilin-type processing-associated H-X9-DG protein